MFTIQPIKLSFVQLVHIVGILCLFSAIDHPVILFSYVPVIDCAFLHCLLSESIYVVINAGYVFYS